MYGLDLFSGIGGITKALEGYIMPVAYCEKDQYAQTLLLSRMATGDLPLAPIWDDIETLEGAYLPAIDIIFGGFPCQDISLAGRGAGLEGKRSILFFQIARLVGEIRPRFVFLENVPAIRTRGADIVVKELARLGYDCRWDVLSASDMGASHKRERWWLLAHSQSNKNRRLCKSRIQPNSGTKSKNVANTASRKQRTASSRSNEWRLQKEILRTCRYTHDWKIEPSVGRVVDGLPFRVDRLRALGNSVVPACAREAFERLMGLR